MQSKEGIEKAINNLWNSLDEELFNLTYSQEEMQEDLRIVLNEYNYLNVLNDRKDQKIRQLESDKQKLIEKLEEKNRNINKLLDEMMTDMGKGIKIINVTGLTRKEKEEVVNKRNCLLVQEYCYEEILKILKGER